MFRPWAGVLVEDPYHRLADGLTFWTRQILCKMKWDTQKPKCPFKCKQHKVIKGEGSCAQASAVNTIDSKRSESIDCWILFVLVQKYHSKDKYLEAELSRSAKKLIKSVKYLLS